MSIWTTFQTNDIVLQMILLTALIIQLILLLYRVFGAKRAGTALIDVPVFAAGMFLLLICLTPENAALPKPVFWLAAFCMLGYAALCLRREKLARRQKLTRISIKEALDDLPCGLCFARADGMIVLCNRQMHHLAYLLTQKDLQSERELWNVSFSTGQGCRLLLEEQDKKVYVFEQEGTWLFTREGIVCGDGARYTQIMAAEVSQLYRRSGELSKNNAELQAMSVRMKRMLKNVTAIAREEEVLAMKMKVHDDIGRCIIATRRLLAKKTPRTQDVRQTAEMWRASVRLLKNSDPADHQQEMLAELKRKAADIGVGINIAGTMPQDGQAASLILSAMRECVTNTVRHAKGSEINVRIKADRYGVCTVITNNGDPPAGEITEGGGLTDLRQKIESAAGMMQVTATPVFALTVTLPFKKGEEK